MKMQSGEDMKELEMQQAAALTQSGSYSASYTLPHQRRGKGGMGTKFPTYTDGKDSSPGAADEKDNEVLMFHGIVLRSQLVEMLKNKTFFKDKDGVSLIICIM